MTPDAFTNQELMLDVGDGHEIYVQDWGKADAKPPIVFLHGGPGGGVKDRYKATFEPTLQRVIFFDQRGCGKSTPYGSLEHNTTPDLIDDIEKIANKLALDTFILQGGSWGSCLALAYGIRYPHRVKAMVLRGIFTGRKSEIEWIDMGGFQAFFPDVWDKFVAATPSEYTKQPAAYYLPRILSNNADAAKEAAYIYGQVESSLLNLDDRYSPPSKDEFDPTPFRMEAHYFTNDCFMSENYIFDNAGKLTMPIWLIQGRYDMVCPPITAYLLHQKLPNSQVVWTVAGHGNDRANYDVSRTILLQMAAEQQG